MNTKYLIAALIASLTLAMAAPVLPALAFWHKPGACAYFAVDINGTGGVNGTDPTDPYLFIEPFDGYCTNFNVTVWMLGVTDLYGYEFTLTWNTYYFNLVSFTVNKLWPAQFQIYPKATYDKSSPFKAVVGAEAPSTGITGDFALVTFVFHIKNDVCFYPPAYYVEGSFDTSDTKASNSCSQPIPLCEQQDVYWRFWAVEPCLYLDPKKPTCSAVGTSFTETVWIENITKMTDFDITVFWDGYFHQAEYCSADNNKWTVLLTTSEANVVVNDQLGFDPDLTVITVVSPACGWYLTDPYGYVAVHAELAADADLINATHPGSAVWLFKITFTQCDPWFCGKQPQYTPKSNHDWKLETACTNIYFDQASVISRECGDLLITDMCYKNAKFCFLPIPGDLNGDGIVDVADLMIEASYYGHPSDCAVPAGGSPQARNTYYDLNQDGSIDIYDLVIVAKNFGRTTPSDP